MLVTTQFSGQSNDSTSHSKLARWILHVLALPTSSRIVSNDAFNLATNNYCLQQNCAIFLPPEVDIPAVVFGV